jgi:hypothetical protein
MVGGWLEPCSNAICVCVCVCAQDNVGVPVPVPKPCVFLSVQVCVCVAQQAWHLDNHLWCTSALYELSKHGGV